MFAKLFQKPTQSQSPENQNAMHQNMAPINFAPQVPIHYGIPSTASVLAFDPIQRLLAIGTLDGRIKVIGGDNIEGLLISPKALPFKNLEFVQNQGFLVSVSNENEIQVWDLENRCLSSNLLWESNITAFSIIYGTHYMYVGDEYGFLSVLKYDAEERKILPLSYHIPPNLIAEGAGVSLPDQISIVGVLSQPCSSGNRVLIAYENGLIILWDVTEDRAVLVRGYKDLQLKEETVVNFSNDESHTYLNDSLDELAEKEISSLCWVSPNGSVLAVGYIDGDILLWDFLVPGNVTGQRAQRSSNHVVKIQLSSGDRRLPVIVLHWSPSNAQNGCRGQLFAYGGEDIGSEEVLTILDLDWSSGLSKLKCVARVDLALHGSFADVIVISDPYKGDSIDSTSVFLLTNPGQLHFYDYPSLSTFKSGIEKNYSTHAVQYHAIIPTAEPYMTVGKLYSAGSEGKFFSALTETDSNAKLQADNMMTRGRTKWPLTGGVPCQLSSVEDNLIQRIYIGGYQDGSVRIWDVTLPVLSLIFVLGFEMKDIEVDGAAASVSALDFCSASLTIAIGNERGLVCLYRLERDSNNTNLTIVAETKHEVHPHEEKSKCHAIFSTLNSPVLALQFVSLGVRLAAGFECGQVAMLDTGSLSVLFITDCISSPRSPVIFLDMKTFTDTHENSLKNSESGTESSAKEIAFVLTRNAQLALIDSASGKMITSQTMHSDKNSTAISMYLLEGKVPLTEEFKKHIETTLPHFEAKSQPVQTSHQKQSDSSEIENTMQLTYFEHMLVGTLILLCCEDALYLYSLKSIIQGENNFVSKLELEKPCCWTTIVKKNAEEIGFIIVYQTGETEIRSFPDLEMVGDTSLMSILRWNFKNNMEKTMSASDDGQIALVNGCEFALISLLSFEKEFRIPENLPCLHDKVVAAAAASAISFSQSQRKTQSPIPGFIGNMMKGLKGEKEELCMNYNQAHETLIAHLESIFSRFPFSDPYNSYDEGDMELHIDDIEVDEPVPTVSSSLGTNNDGKEKETERERLFEGGSSDTKPRVRTREEIIAKYRNTGDAATAAAQAKDKLLERREKLEKLSERTEELQSGAENFASMAHELAKAMEKRKWWNI